MDILSILNAALPLAMGAAGMMKVAEATPKVPITTDDHGTAKHLSVLGAVVVLLMAVQKVQEGNASSIDPTEVVAALGVAYVSAIGMLGALRSYFVKK